MPKQVLLLVTAIVLIFISACTGQTGVLKASLGEEFTLTEGQTTAIQGASLKLKFLEVAADSRCPTGVTCIWAGEVKCNVEITSEEGVEEKALVQSGGTSGFASIKYKEYRIDFDVQPYPTAGKEISKGEYRLILKVTR
jgi:hypothetical protein